MPSTDHGASLLEAILWASGTVIVVILSFASMISSELASCIILLAIGIGYSRHWGRDEDDDLRLQPAIPSGSWTPVRRAAPDKDHPLWDRWLDG
jgi:hypothetical protein